MNAMARACIPHLVELGFTELEATAYTFLVQESPATGYRIAQGIGKPVANTYKALDSLRQKGAVIVDQTARRRCRAVPPTELFAHIEERRRNRIEQASRALATLQPATGDDGVYTLTSRRQILERCRDMLARAEQVALLDLFPDVLGELRETIEATAARGVLVAVQVYEPARLAGVEIVLQPNAAAIQKRWPGQWLNLVIDGAEHLIAFLGKDVLQAVWSRSPYLSWIYHSGLWSEMVASRLGMAIDEGASAPAMQRMRRLMNRFLSPDVRGYQQLRLRLSKGRSPSLPTPDGSRRGKPRTATGNRS
jgi:HTH-type transcriptional regulator, sugar sensing transcriptional regulator